MYDTVVASIPFDLDDEEIFTHQSVVDDVIRMWRNPLAGVYEPRLTYWRLAAGGGGGRLRVEFSIPKMLGLPPLSNPDQAATLKALSLVDRWLWYMTPHLPNISEWQAQRIDYAWNFEASADVPQYITMLQGLWLGGMSRHPHPDAEGVVWKSKQANHRWVKFYNKSREAGSNGTPVLRFEVSNYRRSLAYMCEKWLGCGRTVGELLQPGRALYVMARMWSRLGLFSSTYHADGALLFKLHELFGNAAAGAYYALSCITRYGADTHKLHHLMGDNAYYTWKRRLNEHDLLVHSDVYLPPLSLPVVSILKELFETRAQDLKKFFPSQLNTSPKNLPKNWETWAKMLQVSNNSPEIGRFTALLHLSLEQIYAENGQLGGLSRTTRQARTETVA